MITQNEIEARTRRISGSRRAENGERANPPNSPFRQGRGMGPWETPAALSAAYAAGALSTACVHPAKDRGWRTGRGAPLPVFCPSGALTCRASAAMAGKRFSDMEEML